jgi:hypothetical protein
MLGYIDAASGGMIVAAVAGGMAGLRVAVKSLVPGRRRRPSPEDPAQAPEDLPETSSTESR